MLGVEYEELVADGALPGCGGVRRRLVVVFYVPDQAEGAGGAEDAGDFGEGGGVGEPVEGLGGRGW